MSNHIQSLETRVAVQAAELQAYREAVGRLVDYATSTKYIDALTAPDKSLILGINPTDVVTRVREIAGEAEAAANAVLLNETGPDVAGGYYSEGNNPRNPRKNGWHCPVESCQESIGNMDYKPAQRAMLAHWREVHRVEGGRLDSDAITYCGCYRAGR